MACTILFSLIFGCFIGATGLADPDTCWLLALGRQMFEQHALPATDPFSFTFATLGRPFVMYQWLSELLFYGAYRIAHEVSLLCFAAVLLAVSFWLIPLRTQAKTASTSALVFLGIVGSVASAFHLLVRPEIFSDVCIGLCMALISQIMVGSKGKIVWKPILLLVALFVVWANLHTGFFLGMVLLAIALLCSVLAALFAPAKVKQPGASKALLVALALSFVGTLCTPFGLNLWTYLPGLFFAPFNVLIQELRPLRFSDLKEFTYYPYLLFVAISSCRMIKSLIRLCRSLKPDGTSSQNSANTADATPNGSFTFEMILTCFATTIVFLVAGFVSRRMIPFGVLVTLMNAGYFWCRSQGKSFLDAVETKLQSAMDVRNLAWSAIFLAIVLYGCFVGATQVVKAQIPQSGRSFVMPVEAFTFLEKNIPAGHVFNDAQYGDIIIWKQLPMQVFIDTRYDMYGTGLIADYLTINRCQPGWQNLLDKYQIKWIFMPANSLLAETLQKETGWSQIHTDKLASIFSRK